MAWDVNIADCGPSVRPAGSNSLSMKGWHRTSHENSKKLLQMLFILLMLTFGAFQSEAFLTEHSSQFFLESNFGKLSMKPVIMKLKFGAKPLFSLRVQSISFAKPSGDSELPLGVSSTDLPAKIAKVQSDIEEKLSMAAANDAEIDRLVNGTEKERTDLRKLEQLRAEQITLLRVLFQFLQQLKELELQEKEVESEAKTKEFLLIQQGLLRTGDLGDVSLAMMCRKGANCECAKSTSRCNISLNTIGATDGYLGAAALLESRSKELEEFKDLLKSDQRDIELGKRRSLFQVSQCPGIGKTTMLGLFAKEFPRLLAESQESGQATDRGAIGCLVTYNGEITSKVLGGITVEAALCIRVLYGALACHSAQTGKKCDNLVSFDEMAKQISKADLTCRIDVPNTREVLWRWFGRRPIFVGIDEALKCRDGMEKEKLQCLLTAAGTFLDTSVDNERVSVVISALSPEIFLSATLASSRAIQNILVFPLETSYAVDILRNLTAKWLPGVKVSDMVLSQVEAITGGHARAIGEAVKFLTTKRSISEKLSTWENARDIYFLLADSLRNARAMLASCPRPDVFDYLISNPPVVSSANQLKVGEDNVVLLDQLIYTGQVLVVSGLKITVAPWAFLSLLKTKETKFPSTLLLQEACKLSFDPFHNSSWFEGFCIYFVADAMRRGGKTLEEVVPHLDADSGTQQSISIEDVAGGSNSWSERFNKPLKGKFTDEERKLAQAKMVMDRVNELKYACASAGSKCVILVMPPIFTALDAILVTQDKVVGIQINSKIKDDKFLKKVSNVRSWLKKWQVAGCDLLGPDGLVMYMVGVDKAPAGLNLMTNEKIVIAGRLRAHFLDVFFRFGLTGGESNYPDED